MSVRKTDSGSNSLAEPKDLKIAYGIEGVVETEPRVGMQGESAWIIDHHAERALCRKFDYRLLPVLALMYLFNALDKGNLGNAKTDNMEKDLHFKSNQYNIILSVFYVPYVLGAPPIAMLGKKFGPARVLPILMGCFGSFTLLTGKAANPMS
jgi:sugar phosphate permease